MLIKQEKNKFHNLKRGFLFFTVAEGFLMLGSYTLYAACNRSQDTRKYLHDRSYLRFLLDFYYKTGELMGSEEVKKYDQETWAAQEKLEKLLAVRHH